MTDTTKPTGDDLMKRAQDLLIAKMQAQPRDAWKKLFWDVAGALGCLPSSFVDGNEHVLQRATEAHLALVGLTPSPSVHRQASAGQEGDDEPSEVETVIACLGDDAAMLRSENPESEVAENMDRASDLLAILSNSTAVQIAEALTFYAAGNHFIQHDSSAWDTVSGEPPNFYEDEANTATVEDGSIAKLAIAALSTAAPESGWRPITDAERDGSLFLVNDTTGLFAPYCMAKWLQGEEWAGWVYDDDVCNDSNPLGPQPTHCMWIDSIPAAPTAGETL